MPYRFPRNWTMWCRTCGCYRNIARDDRTVCQVCRHPWRDEPPKQRLNPKQKLD